MRSNGAAHIGNDTFLAATTDVTDSLLLFSGSFPAEEQIVALPLARKVRFHPHAALSCTASELEHYTTAAACELSSTKADPAQRSVSRTTSEALTSPLFRHSLHASPDGRQVAVISNVRRHHYIVDMVAEAAAVCALEMPEIVRSVCWHPVTQHVLYVLFVSGDMVIYDTSRSRLGVVLPRHRRVALRPPILRCLAEAEEDLSGVAQKSRRLPSSPGAPAPAASASKAKNGAACTNGSTKSNGNGHHESKSTAQAVPTGAATPQPFISPSVYTVDTSGDACHGSTVHTRRSAFDEVVPVDDNTDDECVSGEEEGTVAAASNKTTTGVSNTLHHRTSETDLVDLYVLAPTLSMPAIMLVLSSSGDVCAMHLSEDTLPALATAAAVDDGRVRTVEEERKRLAALAANVNIEVHHLIKGELTANSDEALAVRGCLVDADAGTHAVFFCTANGVVKGAWVSEPDLLARHRAAHVRTVGNPNISFTVHLDSRDGSVRECLSPAVPSTTHAVTMTLLHNICLIRRGETGEASYLLALPCWDRQRKGWSCWQPTCEDARTSAELRRTLPLLSTENAVPQPIALRLPYDTRGSSVALGVQDLTLVPEASMQEPGSCRRRRIVSVTLLSLLRSALYTRCGTLQLHPIEEALKAPLPTTGTTKSAKPGAAASRGSLLALVNLLPTCHRRWLCAAPLAEVDRATVELASLVECHTKDLAQRERMQNQRRERLMARVAALEGRVSDMHRTYDKWQQTLLDAIAHRRGAAAVRTANERLGEVHTMLNEWEHQQ